MSLKASTHLQHWEQGNFLCSTAAAKQLRPLDPQEQYSMHAVATYTNQMTLSTTKSASLF